MTVFVRSNIAKFGQNEMHNFKKKNLFAPKNDNEQNYEERKYNCLKEKILTNKIMPNF